MNQLPKPAKPKLTVIAVVFGFLLLVAAGTVGFSLLFNAIQAERRERALRTIQERGLEVNNLELDRRYPTIEFF